jgi:rod shape-determining protein MreD
MIPNILLAYLFVLNLKFKMETAFLISFLLGLMFDSTQSYLLGFHALTFVVIAYLIDILHQHTHKENGWVVSLGMFSVVLIYHLFWLLLIAILRGQGVLLIPFLASILMSAMLNLGLSFLLLLVSRLQLRFDE